MSRAKRMHYNELRWLTPDTQEALRLFIARLADMGLSPKVAETYRPQSTQDLLVSRSKKMILAGRPPLTKTDHSWHTVGRAADVNISPMDLGSILKFLDLAEDLGFRTIADPAVIRAADQAGDKVALNKALWDWHHVEFRNGRSYADAKTEYNALLARGPDTGVNLATLAGGALTIGAVGTAMKHGPGN